MPIDPLSAARAYQEAARAAQAGGGTESAGVDFGALVQEAVRSAGQAAATAETQALAGASGNGNLVDVVTAIAAAETQMEAVMAVRDQVIQAYQEILRMPI